MRARASTGDRGSATVLVVVHAAVLLVLGVALAAVVAVVHQHRVAQAAADLAALAGARADADGADGCGQASSIARANGAQVASCSVAEGGVRITVRVQPPSWPPGLPDLSADARAGPA